MSVLSQLNLSDKTRADTLTSPEARVRAKMLAAIEDQMDASKNLPVLAVS